MKYICDTNFILRYLLADNQAMFDKAKAVFDKAKTGEVTLIIEETVFTETIFVLSSFYKVPRAKIAEILSELLAYKGISAEREVCYLALKYYSEYTMHLVDCWLLAKQKLTGIPILSFDAQLNSLLPM